MRILWVVACLVAAAFAAIGFAHAQDATTLKKEMIGQWELSTTERSKTCVVTMKGDAAAQGFKLELEPLTCQRGRRVRWLPLEGALKLAAPRARHLHAQVCL